MCNHSNSPRLCHDSRLNWLSHPTPLFLWLSCSLATGGLLNTTYVLYFRFYRGTAVFIDTLRDDGVAFFLATTTAILLFLAQTVASASEPAIAWALSNPGLLLFASIDIWLLRFDRAALSRVLAHVSLIRTQTDATAQVASVAGLTPVACKSVPDLEDMSLRNGVRTANVLSQCNMARRFYTVTFVTHRCCVRAVARLRRAAIRIRAEGRGCAPIHHDCVWDSHRVDSVPALLLAPDLAVHCAASRGVCQDAGYHFEWGPVSVTACEKVDSGGGLARD